MKPAGYSGTPLAKKLGFAEGLVVHVSGAPDGYPDLVGETPGVIWRRSVGARLDVAPEEDLIAVAKSCKNRPSVK